MNSDIYKLYSVTVSHGDYKKIESLQESLMPPDHEEKCDCPCPHCNFKEKPSRKMSKKAVVARLFGLAFRELDRQEAEAAKSED